MAIGSTPTGSRCSSNMVLLLVAEGWLGGSGRAGFPRGGFVAALGRFALAPGGAALALGGHPAVGAVQTRRAVAVVEVGREASDVGKAEQVDDLDLPAGGGPDAGLHRDDRQRM